jgi:hypothetical protein
MLPVFMVDVYVFHYTKNANFLFCVSLSHRSALPQAAIEVRFWALLGFYFV